MIDLETARLHLRPLEPEDLDDYYARIFADPEVMRTLTGQPIPRDGWDERVQKHFGEHWERHGFGPWIVVHKEDQQVIGHCGLRFWPDSPEVEVFYSLARAYWGRGLATEGARASLRFGFEHLGLDYIMAGARVENVASRRVLEKIGMTYERPFTFMGFDVVRYGIARQDFRDDGSFYRLIPR